MNFLRTKFQRVIYRVRAFRRHFRRPRQISVGVNTSITEIEAYAEAEVPEPFQLLDLPQVVQRKIVLHSDPLTLIDLSMTSDEFNEKMKEIKLPAEVFMWYIFKDQTGICCHFEEQDSNMFLMYGSVDLIEPIVERRIGGKMRLVNLSQMDKPEDGRLSYISYNLKLSQRHQSEEEVQITAQLLDIIRPEKYCLRLYGGSNFIDLFVLKFSMTFDAILLDEEYATDLFGPKEAQFLFQEVAVREIVIKFERRSEDWRRKRRTELMDTIGTIQLRNTIQEITVYNLDFFSAENIINSEIKSLRITFCSEDPYEPVFYKELNKIMKAWQEGEKLTQLEKIKTSCEGISDEKLESLFEGIDWTSERPDHPDFKKFVAPRGLVRDSLIRRRTDGQLASLSKYKNTFHFVVWKEGILVRI